MSKKKVNGGSRDMFDGYDSAFEDTGTKGKKKSGSHTSTNYQRCYHTHPELKLGGGVVYGGSCISPAHLDCDIYIGLDSSMYRKTVSYPWAPTTEVHGPEEVLFRISDMAAPSDEQNFVAMINWMVGKLKNGAKIHVGCMGGHGRTGMVLSALVKVVTGNVDSTTWVRENYCKKVVESNVQVKFLKKFFGIKEVAPSKNHDGIGGYTSGNYGSGYSWQDKGGGFKNWGDYIPGTGIERSKGPRDLKPVTGPLEITALANTSHSIWGKVKAL